MEPYKYVMRCDVMYDGQVNEIPSSQVHYCHLLPSSLSSSQLMVNPFKYRRPARKGRVTKIGKGRDGRCEGKGREGKGRKDKQVKTMTPTRRRGEVRKSFFPPLKTLQKGELIHVYDRLILFTLAFSPTHASTYCRCVNTAPSYALEH